MKLLVLFFCSLLAISSFANAETATCLDKKKANAMLNSFKIYGDAKINYCDPNNKLTQILEALIYLKELQLDKAKGPFATNIFGSDPFSYFKKRVSKIVIDNRSRCDGITMAYVIHDTAETIYLCPLFFSPEYDFLQRPETLLHEARHHDPGNYTHTKCRRGIFSFTNADACDESLEYQGSYGVSAEFYNRLSRTSTVNPSLRMTTQGYFAAYITTRFNKLPGDLKDGVFLVDTANKLSFFDGSSNQYLQTIPQDGLLTFAQNMQLSLGKNNTRFSDFAATEKYLCGLTSQELKCVSHTRKEDSVSIRLSQIQPRSIYSANYGQNKFMITVTDNLGRMMDLPTSLDELRKMRESDFKLRRNVDQVLKVQSRLPFYDGINQVMLKDDGRIFLKKGQTLTPVLTNQKFKNVVGPSVWSPALGPL